MEIILLERVARLGGMGDVVDVKNGFARNYLIPQGKALRATKSNKEEFEARKGEISKQNDTRRAEAQKVADKMKDVTIELVRQASDDGRLYGSVTVRDIGEVLEEKGFTIPRQNLLLEKAIKEVGQYTVQVNPHPEIDVTLPVRVARNESEFLRWDEEEKEAEEQAKRDAEADANPTYEAPAEEEAPAKSEDADKSEEEAA